MESLKPHKIDSNEFYSLKDVETLLNLSYATVHKLTTTRSVIRYKKVWQ